MRVEEVISNEVLINIEWSLQEFLYVLSGSFTPLQFLLVMTRVERRDRHFKWSGKTGIYNAGMHHIHVSVALICRPYIGVTQKALTNLEPLYYIDIIES
jgi:hypothetical protein